MESNTSSFCIERDEVTLICTLTMLVHTLGADIEHQKWAFLWYTYEEFFTQNLPSRYSKYVIIVYCKYVIH